MAIVEIDDEDIEIIMRQTTYDKDTATNKYLDANCDIEKVLLDFCEVDKTLEEKELEKMTNNQKVMKGIRDMMYEINDTGETSLDISKLTPEQKKEYLNSVNAVQQRNADKEPFMTVEKLS